MAVGRKRKADTNLLLALACGASPEAAAQKSGLSPRTVYRRMAESSFRQQVQQVRTEMVTRSAGMFTAAGLASLKTLATLQEAASSESVRLAAARAIIELGCKLRDNLALQERMAEMEARLESLLGDVTAPDGVGDRTVGAPSE